MDELDKKWIKEGIERELANIEKLSSESDPSRLEKPDSPITLSILKIASIVNGYSLDGSNEYRRILYALRCHPASSKPKRIEYQWARCLKRAYPRRRQNETR